MKVSDCLGGFKGHVKRFIREKGVSDWCFFDEFDNVVTSQTKSIVMDFLQSGTGVYLSHFGVGSGTTAESVGDGNNEFPLDVTSAAAPHKVFALVVNNGQSLRMDCELSTTEPSVQPCTVSEIALFSAVSGGSCFGHVTHTGYPKTDGIEMRYEYSISVK